MSSYFSIVAHSWCFLYISFHIYLFRCLTTSVKYVDNTIRLRGIDAMSPKLCFVFGIRTNANVLKHIDSDVKFALAVICFEIKYFSASSEDISSTCGN